MEKSNKRRAVFWSIIAIILVSISIYGIILTQNGYGDIGYIINRTKPIAESFNNLSDIKKLKETGLIISAKAKNDTIEMQYKTDNSNSKFKFTYKKNEKNEEFIVMEYHIEDDAIAKILTRYMIDAISVNDGYKEKQIYDYYKIDDFKKTNKSEGASIRTNNNLTTVTLNINHSVLDNINFDSIPDNIDYIDEENANKIVSDLIPNSNKVYKTENIILHIDMYEEYYAIYISDNNQTYSDNLYLSLTSLIKVLSNNEIANEFNTIISENNNIDYNNEESNISIKYDITTEYEEFNNYDKIIQVEIKK